MTIETWFDWLLVYVYLVARIVFSLASIGWFLLERKAVLAFFSMGITALTLGMHYATKFSKEKVELEQLAKSAEMADFNMELSGLIGSGGLLLSSISFAVFVLFYFKSQKIKADK